MKRRSSEDKAEVTAQRADRIFFPAYFLIITSALLWSLFHCTGVSWEVREAFLSQDGSGYETTGSIELLDGSGLSVFTSSGSELSENTENPGNKSVLRGAALLGYDNTNGLRFLDETIKAEVLRRDTGEVLGSGVLPLRNQTPFSTDETMMYVPFGEPVRGVSGEDLEVRFSSTGLTRNGIFFSGQEMEVDSDAGEDGLKTVAARLYYEKKTWNPVNAVVTWFLAAAAGLLCMMLRRTDLFPLFQKSSGGDRASDGSRPGTGRAGGSLISIRGLTPLLLILLLCLCMFVTAYVLAVRRNVGTSSAEFLVPQDKEKETVQLRAGESVRQALVPGQDRLSGFGVRLKSGSAPGGVLVWNLLDESGTEVLGSGRRAVEDLVTIAAVLPTDQQSGDIQEAAFKYKLLSLDSVISGSAGTRYILELSLEGTPGEEGSPSVTLLAASHTNGSVMGDKDGSGTWEEDGNAMGEEGGEGPQGSRSEICLIAAYKNNRFLRGMYLTLCAGLLVMLTGLFFAAKAFRGRTAAMYLACALCMGMVFSFMTPAYTISDERAHIDSVYLLSNRLLGIMDEPGPGRIWKRACDIDTSIGNTMPVTLDRYRSAAEGLFGAAGKERQLAPAYARTALDNVPLLCYLPAALGFSAARLLGRNLITMIMMARWANLLACALVIGYAVRKMPFGAAVPALIALFPKSLQQISSCSYDGMIIAGIFFFTASCLKLAYDEKNSVTDILLLILSGIFTAACKGGAYLPMVGLALIIPFVRAGKDRKSLALWIKITAASAGGAAFLFLSKYVIRLFRMFSRSSGSATILAGKRSVYTISDFVHSPGSMAKIFMTTLHTRADGLLGEMVGKNLSQKWYLIYAFILLVVLAVLHRRGEKTCLCLPARLWMLFLAFCSTMLIFLSMLIAFTVRGADVIEGLQGRYFLPLAPLIFLAAENRSIVRDGVEDTTLLYVADVLLVITFCELLIYYLRLG